METTTATRAPGMEVKLARIEQYPRQEDAAAALGIDRGRLSAIELGKIPPRLVRAHEIAAFQRVLGVPPEVWLAQVGE